MNKQDLLKELQNKIKSGELTRTEVKTAMSVSSNGESHLTRLFYWIGGLIALIGLVFLVGQMWDDLGSASRIVITLGTGLVLTILGSTLLKKDGKETIGTIFHVLGGPLASGGSFVLLYESGVDFSTVTPVIWTLLVLTGFYAVLTYVHKTAITTAFTILHATGFVYTLIGKFLENAEFGLRGDLLAWATVIIGIAYILLGHVFTKDMLKQKLTGLLYVVGSFMAFGALFSFVEGSLLWQLLYFVILAGGYTLATRMKQTSILITTTIFLLVHISFITAEYFADSIGWPITLVLLGFIFIGIGYGSVRFNKKYIKN